MKKITLGFFMILTQLSFSQVVVWSDNFNDEDISDWTLIDSDGDGNNWGDQFVITNSGGVPVTPVSLISRSWQGSALTPDNWAISPAIDLSGAAGTITLDWITQVAAAEWDEEKYSVHVGTSSDINVLLTSPTSLTETLGDAGNTGTPTSKSLDISSLAGSPTVYVAFRHWDTTDKDFLSIDDVTVNATTLNVDEFSDNSFTHSYKRDLDILTVESSSLPFDNIKFFNLLGQEVMSKTLSQTSESLDLSGFQDGVYIAKVSIEGQVQTMKFLKQ